MLLHFRYGGFRVSGHDCINFKPNQYWLVFATAKGGHLELFDDCIGALGISSRLGPRNSRSGWLAQMEADFMEILNEGAARLRQLGFDPVAKLVRGQPAEEIGNFAREVGADLIVVGHRRQSAFDRWWSGPKGSYLMDYTDCSLLVARNAVSDEAIEVAFLKDSQTDD